MAGSSFMNIIPLCVFFLFTVLISVNSSKDVVTNYLPTGKTLESEAELSYANSEARLLMRFDCYLVLYNRDGKLIWQSTVPVIGVRNCSLQFNDKGQLAVRNDHGGLVWTSPNNESRIGKYVAVLRPEGKLSIYGPSTDFFVGEMKESISSISNNNNVIVSSMNTLKNAPPVYNMLFSGNVLYNGGKISDNGYSLAIEDCELVLRKGYGELVVVLWTSNTKGNGKHCFARLNHNGVLVIFDDNGKTVWLSESPINHAPTGEYVLVLHRNGYPVIYEPEVWFTPKKNKISGLIEMPSAKI